MGCSVSRSGGGEIQRPQAKPHTPLPSLQAENIPRFAACSVLYEAGIPVCIWLEDALERLGVPTMVFDLFLLVHDVGAAARVLTNAGYHHSKSNLAISAISQFNNVFTPAQEKSQDLALAAQSLDGEETSVILLAASEWFYHLPENTEDMADWFPTLPYLLSSLVAKWLDLDETELTLRLRIAVFFGYIYEYLDAVKSPGFERQLPKKYWAFHFDQLRGINTADLGTFRCQQYYLGTTRGTT